MAVISYPDLLKTNFADKRSGYEIGHDDGCRLTQATVWIQSVFFLVLFVRLFICLPCFVLFCLCLFLAQDIFEFTRAKQS